MGQRATHVDAWRSDRRRQATPRVPLSFLGGGGRGGGGGMGTWTKYINIHIYIYLFIFSCQERPPYRQCATASNKERPPPSWITLHGTLTAQQPSAEVEHEYDASLRGKYELGNLIGPLRALLFNFSLWYFTTFSLSLSLSLSPSSFLSLFLSLLVLVN